MSNFLKNTLLFIFGIVLVIVLVIVIMILKKSYFKKPIDNDDLLTAYALKRTGVEVIEKFQSNTDTSDIVFDSIDTIKNNIDLFINTYYPSIYINDINETLEQYGIPKTMQELISENTIDMNNYINNIVNLSLQICIFKMNEYLTKDIKSDVICAGLVIVLVEKMQTRMKKKVIYLNDFDKADDFYIYYLPESYDVSNLTTDNDIPKHNFRDRNISTYYVGNDLTKPYKVGIISYIINHIKEGLNLKTNDEINNVFKIFSNNFTPMYTIFKLQYFIAPYIILYTKKKLTESSQIIIDLIEAIKPNNYSEDFIKIFPQLTPEKIKQTNYNLFRIDYLP